MAVLIVGGVASGSVVQLSTGSEIVHPTETAVEANACGRCGDGFCATTCGETATSCPRDCGVRETETSCQ